MRRPFMDYAIALSVAGLAALGGAAMVLGEIDDAPGAILIGMFLVIAAVVLHLRTGRQPG